MQWPFASSPAPRPEPHVPPSPRGELLNSRATAAARDAPRLRLTVRHNLLMHMLHDASSIDEGAAETAVIARCGQRAAGQRAGAPARPLRLRMPADTSANTSPTGSGSSSV